MHWEPMLPCKIRGSCPLLSTLSQPNTNKNNNKMAVWPTGVMLCSPSCFALRALRFVIRAAHADCRGSGSGESKGTTRPQTWELP